MSLNIIDKSFKVVFNITNILLFLAVIIAGFYFIGNSIVIALLIWVGGFIIIVLSTGLTSMFVNMSDDVKNIADDMREIKNKLIQNNNINNINNI